MKEYKNYKKSSLEFIGKIPVEWKEGKIRYFFDISRGRVISKQELKSDGQFPVYSSQTKNDGCLGYIKTYDYEGEKLTWTTDGANAGEVFHRSGKFNCTNVCGILDAKEKDIYLKFFMYSLQFVTQFYKRPDTNGAKIMSNEMANIYTVLPSPSEQTKIAQYLDHKTGLIDNLIQKKEELIKKLEEQRQAIINEAVTKGLDPNAKMKNSGVEWLGEIPEGWKIVPMRFLTKKIGSGVTPRGGASVYQDEGIIFLRSQNIYDQGLRIDDVSRISNEIHEKMSGSKVMKDDVLLNITGASIGRSSIFNLDEEANVNQHVCIIRPNEKVVPEYLHFLMQSEVGKLQVKLGTTGGNREGLNFEAIKKFRLPIPKRKEQYEILNSVSTKLNDLHLINSKLINQIQLLKNYRQSIISEAVTGKIDVREWETKK